ncbi:hypothetical protein NC652_002735 [Populus alba x Populus x berolinensis]|nr:hypothetical protein NC652_002735 [Populus alba x Populus x berolinensis]
MGMVMEWVKFLEGMVVKYEEMEINWKPGMGIGMELVELLKRVEILLFVAEVEILEVVGAFSSYLKVVMIEAAAVFLD